MEDFRQKKGFLSSVLQVLLIIFGEHPKIIIHDSNETKCEINLTLMMSFDGSSFGTTRDVGQDTPFHCLYSFLCIF